MSNTGMDAWYGQVVGAAERQEREAREREHAEAVEAIRDSGAGYGRELDDYDVAEMRRGGLRPNEVAGEFLRRYARTGGARDLSSGERLMSPTVEAPHLFPPVERTIPSEAEIVAGGLAAGAQAVGRTAARGVYEFGRGIVNLSADIFEMLGADPEETFRSPSYEEIGGNPPESLAEDLVSTLTKYGMFGYSAWTRLSGLSNAGTSLAGRVLQTGARAGVAGAAADFAMTDPREGLLVDSLHEVLVALYGADSRVAELAATASPKAHDWQYDDPTEAIVSRFLAAGEGLAVGAIGGWALKGIGAGAGAAADAARGLWVRADELEQMAIQGLARSRHQLNSGLDPAGAGWLTLYYGSRIARGTKKLTKELIEVATKVGATEDQIQKSWDRAARVAQSARRRAGEMVAEDILEGFAYQAARNGDLSYGTYRRALVEKLGVPEETARELWARGAQRHESEVLSRLQAEPFRVDAPDDALSGVELYTTTPPRPSGAGEGSKRDTARAFHAMARDRTGGIDMRHDESPEAIERLARLMAREAEAALRQPNSAAAWYRENINRYHRLAELLFPEITKDPQNAVAFNFASAVTSNGESVPANTGHTLRVFEYFQNNGGKFPTDYSHKRGAAVNSAFRFWNDAVDRLGFEQWQKFLHGEWDQSQFTALGFKGVTVPPGQTAPGSIVLGPKIGGAFFQNLEGNFWRTTKDLWMRRLFGRLTGSVMEDSPELIAQRTERFLRAFRDVADTGERSGVPTVRELLKLYTGLDELPTDTEQLYEAARVIHQQWGQDRAKLADLAWTPGKRAAKESPGHILFDAKDSLLRADDVDEFHRAARELSKIANEPIDEPDGIENRIIDAANLRAVELLRGAGYDTTPADVQALLWYWEQRLWKRTGIGLDSDTDFATEMTKALQRRGDIDEQAIARINRRGRRDLGSGEHVAGGDALGSRQYRAGIVEDRGRLQFFKEWSASQFRNFVRRGVVPGGRRTFTASGGRADVSALTAEGQVKETVAGKLWKVGDRKYHNQWGAFGVKVPEYVELPVGPDSGRIYADQLQDSIERGFAAAGSASDAMSRRRFEVAAYSVHPYTAEELSTLRLFMAPDAKAGFALSGDDIVAVFNTRGGQTQEHALHSLMLAVQAGGRKLDNFDFSLRGGVPGGPKDSAGLSSLYRRAGFRPVARTPFDPKYRPDRGNGRRWNLREHGRPDIVFQVYDPAYKGEALNLADVPEFATYDEAAAARDQVVARLRGDAPDVEVEMERTMVDLARNLKSKED